MRASYLLSPMPANHLLRDFGQSDREAVSNGNREIATSQLLQLMNGFAEKRILRDDSVLMQRLKQASDVDQKIRMAYQTVLARTPTAEEFEEWKTDFKNHPADATADMVWTILNSTEFLFIQ